jgi:hypothetical protein
MSSLGAEKAFSRGNCRTTAVYPTYSNDDRGRLDCRMIDSSVPIRNSTWSGTGIVTVVPALRFYITTWLPRRRTSANPFLARILHTVRPERVRSLANSDAETSDVDLAVQSPTYFGRLGGFKEEFDGLHQVLAGFFDCSSLARDIELRAERNEAVPLALNYRSEAFVAFGGLWAAPLSARTSLYHYVLIAMTSSDVDSDPGLAGRSRDCKVPGQSEASS